LFDPGSAVLYMKVGNHAQENLASIIARKKREIEEAGLAMWGYGGNTCHPTSRIQPFAQEQARAGRPIILAMHPIPSRHSAEPLRAEEFSSDGFSWEPVPEGIDVLGSRFALCLKTMDEVDTTLNLASTRVAIGASKGKVGSNYVRGQVDKAWAVSSGGRDTRLDLGPSRGPTSS
jgi:hypothetical protein